MSWSSAVGSDQLELAELYQFSYSDGTIEYYTSFESNITWSVDSNVYVAVPINRTAGRSESDLSVGYITIDLPRNDSYVQTSKLLDRYLDNAEVKVTWIDRKNDLNYRVAFLGKIGELSYNLTQVSINVKNELNMFLKKIPKDMYTEGCRHRMYGIFCGLNKATYKSTGSGQAGSTTTVINDNSRTEVDKFFNLGYIEMTSGNNIGEKRSIFFYTVGVIEVDVPFSNAVQVGDGYDIYPHCKKNWENCDEDYSNSLNYGGFQDIPDPSEALI